jgi:hypothetical protein
VVVETGAGVHVATTGKASQVPNAQREARRQFNLSNGSRSGITPMILHSRRRAERRNSGTRTLREIGRAMNRTYASAHHPRYTAQQVIDALMQAKGLITYSAKILGCTERTVRNYMAKHPTVAQAREVARAGVSDLCELRIFEAIQRGESWAIQFYARTQMRDRGYGDQLAIDARVSRAGRLSGKDQPQSLTVDYDAYNRAYAEALDVVARAASDERDRTDNPA